MRLGLLALAAGLLAGAHNAFAQQQPAAVVIIVRHAERAPGSGDPPISEAGRARAAALAEIGKLAGVSAIITTQFQRTRQTAEPLASALGITGVVVPTGADLAKHVADVAAAVRQQAGRTVLVVGHSNTVPLIVAALGGPRMPDLCEPEYDALFTLVIDEGRSVRTVRSRFGAPTPVDGACASMRP
ncbi:MAG TPA: histidine phosphatase family protein [Gemmatimonadaceae bacterium]